MALRYSAKTLGTFSLVQGENKFKIQIRQGNALAIMIHESTYQEENTGKKMRQHTLIMFFMDGVHLRNCAKKGLKHLFKGEVKNIRLNMYYQECSTLLKYFVKEGWNVTCYYKEEK